MNSDKEIRLSEGTIRLAIQRLATKYIFHARVLERFVLGTRPDVATMAVSVFGKNVHLWHCPEFVLGLPMDELIGVLLHEVHHVVLGHILLDPKNYPDEWAFTIATEVTVNEFINEPLPAGGIRLEQFPSLPHGESTERRYRRLEKRKKRPQIVSLSALLQGDARKSGGHTSGVPGSKGPGDAMVVPDEHGAWGKVGDFISAKEVIEEITIEAAIGVGATDIPDHLSKALNAMGLSVGGTGIGTKTGREAGNLQATPGHLLWRRLLRRYVGQCLKVRLDLRRPSRRFPDLIGIVPGRCRHKGRAKILAVIDTSGSMSTELLEKVSGELARLAADHSVIVAECDTEIQRVYQYKPLAVVLGRGGTDLRPPLERAFLRRHRADLVIYFTDGFGPAPQSKPSVPVIWCLTPDGVAPVPWGRIVQMKTDH